MGINQVTKSSSEGFVENKLRNSDVKRGRTEREELEGQKWELEGRGLKFNIL